MKDNSPFVVAIAAADSKVGSSTLTGNLAVYLKGLAEDLPVAVISFDPGFDPRQTFALPGTPAGNVCHLFDGERLEKQLTFGQFGVDYLVTEGAAQIDPQRLRKLLRDSYYPGILLIDAGPLNNQSAVAALQTADLVLAPVRAASGLSALAVIRHELTIGGGNDQMLWLIPTMIEDPVAQAQQLELLRFAAGERGCQVFDEEFMAEPLLSQALAGLGGTVLTRIPHSRAHQLLHHLAQRLLSQFALGADSSCRLQRLRLDGALPPRGHRVDLSCPLCAELASFGDVHYCESLPQRRRWLVHAECMALLITACRLQPFWQQGQAAVVQTGVESANLFPQLRLLLRDVRESYTETELLQPAVDGAWQRLIRHATGRTLAEQFPSLVMIYPAISARRVLTRHWYRRCIALRRQLREQLITTL